MHWKREKGKKNRKDEKRHEMRRQEKRRKEKKREEKKRRKDNFMIVVSSRKGDLLNFTESFLLN